MINTNWIIITGEPRSGKSTLIERIAFEGYRICPEVSRIIIDSYKCRNEKLDCCTEHFEKMVMKEKIAAEKRFNPREYVFWDRGLVDSIAFSRLYRRGIEHIIRNNLKYNYRYIFYLSDLPEYQPDYATLENRESAKAVGEILLATYKELGYSPIIVPQMDIESRVKFIFDIIQSEEEQFRMNGRIYE